MKHESIETARACPVCEAGSEQSEPFLVDSRDERRLTPASFSSRKVPEFMSHAMVRCRACDLAYVDRPPTVAELAASYHSAEYDSAEEAEDAAEAYARAIEPILGTLSNRGSALEIGSGTGAFLEHLAKWGFRDLIGIEPSREAIAAAPAHRQQWIHEGIFEDNRFPPQSFDLICCFMTLEHVQNPRALVATSCRLLRPGGVFVTVTHNHRAWLNRVLGRRSPIVDVEHMQLFSPKNSTSLLRNNGFTRVGTRAFSNRYTLSYWFRLAPIWRPLKSWLARYIGGRWIGKRRISLNVGNFMTWGFKD